MLFEQVIVIRDQHTKITRAVPTWEIPVLHLVYDQGNIQQTGIFEKVEREYPDPGVEFHRLGENYGVDRETKTQFVSLAYGPSSTGLRALAKAIRDAETDELEQMRAGTAPKVKLADIPLHIAAKDPLLA